MKTDENVVNELLNSVLFKGASPQLLKDAICDTCTVIKSYVKGEVIISREFFNRNLVYVLKGEVSINKSDSELALKILSGGDFFGAECIYSPRTYAPADFIAVKPCKLIFFDRSCIYKLTMLDPIFTSNYLTFLSETVYYLYNSVSIYTGGSAESRLASFLLESFGGYKTLQLRQSYSSLAVSLDVGRASLYRAFNSLTECSAIEKEGKYIRLLNEEKLLQFK